MEDDKYIEVLEEEKNDVKKMATWKKVLIAFTGVVVAFMIVIYVAIDYIMRDIDEEWNEPGSQTTTESEEESVPIQKVKRISIDSTDGNSTVWEQQWEALGESQQYLAFGTHVYRKGDDDYRYSNEFVNVLCVIADGWFSGASGSDLDYILPRALGKLSDTASGKEVYDKLVSFTQEYKQEVMVMKKGENPYEHMKRMASPYASERCGYDVGVVETFPNGKTVTYKGKDIWVDTQGETWKASENGKGNIWFTWVNTSPYASEQVGFRKGDVRQFSSGEYFTYQGQDIWTDSNGARYKAYSAGGNQIGLNPIE